MMVIGFFCRTTPLLSFCNDRAVPNRHASSRAGKPGEQMNQVEREGEGGRAFQLPCMVSPLPHCEQFL